MPRFTILNLLHATAIVALGCVIGTLVGNNKADMLAVAILVSTVGLWSYLMGLMAKAP